MKNWIVFEMTNIIGEKLIGMQKGFDGILENDIILETELTRKQATQAMIKHGRARKVKRIDYRK